MCAELRWVLQTKHRLLKAQSSNSPDCKAMPEVISLLEQVNKLLGIGSVAIDLVNAFLPILIIKEENKQVIFTWDMQQYSFIVLPQGYVNSPALCHIVE